jgi:hypothetical protein
MISLNSFTAWIVPALQLMPSPVQFDEWDQDVTAAIEQLKEQVIDDIFTVSFCRNPDLLSQWRGYGGNAQGVCCFRSATAGGDV